MAKKKHAQEDAAEKTEMKNQETEQAAERDEVLKTAEEKAGKAAEEAEKWKNDYLRLMAEFDTFRRRSAEEKLELVKSASTDTIKGLLPVLDDCEIALAQLEKSTDSEAAKEGTQLIYNKLMAYLKTRGLAVIDAKGQPFDTEFHEAVTMFPAPRTSGARSSTWPRRATRSEARSSAMPR